MTEFVRAAVCDAEIGPYRFYESLGYKDTGRREEIHEKLTRIFFENKNREVFLCAPAFLPHPYIPWRQKKR